MLVRTNVEWVVAVGAGPQNRRARSLLSSSTVWIFLRHSACSQIAQIFCHSSKMKENSKSQLAQIRLEKSKHPRSTGFQLNWYPLFLASLPTHVADCWPPSTRDCNSTRTRDQTTGFGRSRPRPRRWHRRLCVPRTKGFSTSFIHSHYDLLISFRSKSFERSISTIGSKMYVLR